MNSGIDKWLSRLSHVAQIGLLLAAVFTIWYTVVPLYGKSILEEQVAEKTIELNKINDQISKQYYVLKKNYSKDLQTGYLVTCVLSPLSKIPEYSERLNYDFTTCFSEVKDKVFKDNLLNEVDEIKFNLAHAEILDNLEIIKNKNKIEFAKIENIQINDIHLLPEIKGYSKKFYDFLQKSESTLGKNYVLETEFQLKKSQAMLNLDSQYKDELTNLIKNSLNKIN